MKHIAITLSCLLFCFMVGCSNNPTSKVQDTSNPKQPESSVADTSSNTEKTSNPDIDTDIQSLPQTDKLESLLASNEHMDIISVSADAKTGIRIEVDNKTNQNLQFLCDSIAINRKTISQEDYYPESNNIAPDSIGDIVLSFTPDADTTKYDFANISSTSGQLTYWLGNDDLKDYKISFSSATN